MVADNAALRQALLAEDLREMTAWTRSMVVEPEAVILPNTLFRAEPGRRAVANGGVYRRDGAIVPSAVHRGGSFGFVPDPWPGLPDPIERLAGRWLYGGVLRNHFGHFVLESLARLWGVAEAGPIAGILFLQFNGVPPDGGALDDAAVAELATVTRRKPFVRGAIRLLCGDRPVHVVGPAVQVEELAIPSQLIGNAMGDLAGGHPDFRAFMAAALRPLRPQDGEPRRRLYVSRARLPAGCISFLFETRLEEALAAEGYEILYPERMSIAHQIAAYQSAGHLIMPTGSAIHLAAYAMTGVQRVALIEREPGAPSKFARQLELFGAAEVVRIRRVWGTVEDRRGIAGGAAKRAPAHILDLDAVWADLRAAGFVTGKARFDDLLGEAPLADAVAALQQRLPATVLAAVPHRSDVRVGRVRPPGRRRGPA